MTRFVAIDDAPHYGKVYRVVELCSDSTAAFLADGPGLGNTVSTSWERTRPVDDPWADVRGLDLTGVRAIHDDEWAY